MSNINNGLISGFITSLNKYPLRPALDVNNYVYSYEQLAQRSFNIAQTIINNESSSEPIAALLAYRSVTAYAGILGILASGKGYVPINPNFPIDRINNLISLAKCNVLIVGSECLEVFKTLLPKLDKPYTVIFPDIPEIEDVSKIISNHKFVFRKDLSVDKDFAKMPALNLESTAYLLFTSGSTGIPKGVAVTHNNVKSFINYICKRYDFNENDRFSQTADINFDLSILEIFPCWERGGCLYCLPKGTVMAPAKYIKDKNLTVWISVPSVGIFMTKMRLLKPGAFPTLRYCLFCGEPLLATSAEHWQNAAPNAIVENLYGPTEASVAITTYKWDKNESIAKCRNGVVPIGWPFEGQMICLIDHNFKVVGQGETGELCLSGSQVTKGYFNSPEKTNHHYITIPSFGNRLWYRTGDIAYQEKDGCLHYIGRVDNQVKILGYRVELQEIDSVLRKASGSDLSVAVPLSNKDGSVEKIVGFICGGNTTSKEHIMDYCSRFLPNYMIPQDLFFINSMPLNANGKIDRFELIKKIERGGI